jgi:hypothetical protein
LGLSRKLVWSFAWIRYALWCKVPQRTPHKLLKIKEI